MPTAECGLLLVAKGVRLQFFKEHFPVGPFPFSTGASFLFLVHRHTLHPIRSEFTAVSIDASFFSYFITSNHT